MCATVLCAKKNKRNTPLILPPLQDQEHIRKIECKQKPPATSHQPQSNTAKETQSANTQEVETKKKRTHTHAHKRTLHKT